MCLIVRLNLIINEQSEKFWYGINDKVSMGEYGKESGENGGVQRIWKSIDGREIDSLGSWVKYGGNMERVWKCGGGMEKCVGEVLGVWGN